MITPVLPSRLTTIAAANATSQTMNDKAALVLYATIGSIAASAAVSALTVAQGSSTPAAGNLGVTATPQSPTAAVKLNADPPNGAGTALTVEFIPVGELLAAF